MKKIILTLVFGIVALMTVTAQTGSFDKDLSFNNETRKVSFYVPNTYNSANSYSLMVCLHGSGDNSSSYRNGIITSLKWAGSFANTIFIFPDGGSDYFSDFFTPAGDEAFIDQAIEYAKSNYNIKSNDIILQGFSLGGRSALKIGLEHPEKFRGLLLNTPALQGPQDLNNMQEASLQYKYENGKNIPIFISVGMLDDGYLDINERLTRVLKFQNAAVYLQKINNMSHTITVGSQAVKCLNFFNTKTVSSNDLELLEVKSPINVCSNTVYTECFIRNNGSTTVTSAKLRVEIGSETFEKNCSFTIQPNEYVKVPFEFNPSDKEASNYTMRIVNTDLDSSNNTIKQNISLSPLVVDGVYKEGFESMNYWLINRTGSFFEWYIDGIAKKTGNSSLGNFNTILYYYTNNSVESVTSRAFDLRGIDKKTLSFDVAFNYTKYTPPYFERDTIFADTLEIQISTDCGQSFRTIYKKGGKELATTPEPMLNALNIDMLDYIPKDEDWRREIIDISEFAGSANAIIKINCISGMGGMLNIDNFALGEDLMGVKQVKIAEKSIRIYPNPAHESFTHDLENIETIQFYDMEGKLVSEMKSELGQQTVNTSALAEGMYIVRFISEKEVASKRIMIQHTY